MDNDEYFGIPEVNLLAARQLGKQKRNRKFNTSVPTRKEVATLDPVKIRQAMLAWMCDSVTEIIPSRAQISEARKVLQARADAQSLSGLIEMCDHYVRGD